MRFLQQAVKSSIRVGSASFRQESFLLFKRNSHVPADRVQVPPIKLYQYAICPFCGKVKALLAFAGIDHEVVEVNPLTKAEIKW
jgi:glutaredoxin